VSQARPAVTIVVPTAGRPERVSACVDALLRSSDTAECKVSAVLVVDNDPTPGPDLGLARDDDPPVRLLREPSPGAARARNRGLAAATTEIVVFVDDDIVVGEDWLDTLVAPLVAAEVVATVGPISLDTGPTRPRWLTPHLEHWYSALDLGPTTRRLGPGERGWSANLAVRRAEAMDAGGFDRRLGPGTDIGYGEDVDLQARLVADGRAVVYAAGAGVTHCVGPDRLRRRWLARRAYQGGRTEVAVDRLAGRAPARRRPLRAFRSLAGGVLWGGSALAGGARDPARHPGLVTEQLAVWCAKAGAAAAYCSLPGLDDASAPGRRPAEPQRGQG
jgi:GT2 family glycosyltransferase